MIWLIGRNGLLGDELSMAFSRAGLLFVGTGRDVSIVDVSALNNFARAKNIDWVINCAAYTAVDNAEADERLCYNLNAVGAGNVATVAHSIGASLIHFSTDYVFGGESSCPYTEDDKTNPVNVYGLAKAEGERLVMSSCDKSLVIRTSWLYGRSGRNFVLSMLDLMAKKPSLDVVFDQRGAPTNAADLADAIVKIIAAPKIEYGVFHFANAGETTWYEFAKEIYRIACSNGLLADGCSIRSVTSAQFSSGARRPAYSVLSLDKIKRVYGIEPLNWLISLERFISALKNDA